MTTRRSFLKGATAASAAALLPAIDTGDGVRLRSMAHPLRIHDADDHDMTKAFGLAPVKAEGQSVAYDPEDA